MKIFQFMLVATVEVKQKIFTNSVPSFPNIGRMIAAVSVINTLRYPVRKSVVMS
jgi:hypothetical protein